MGKTQSKGDSGIGGSLKNSLSKLTGRVTLKAPPAEQLKKETPTQAASKPKPATPKPMSAPQAGPAKTAQTAPSTPAALQQKKQPVAPTSKQTTPSPAAKTPAPAAQAAAPEPAPTASGGVNKLANDVTIEGKLRFSERLVFDGRMKGEIESDGALSIQQAAVVEASIKVKSLLIEGKVVGNITASESVRLSSTAVVIGDISTGNLTVEPNASFQGQAKIGKATQAATPAVKNATQPKAPAQVASGTPMNGKINGKMPSPATSKSPPTPAAKTNE